MCDICTEQPRALYNTVFLTVLHTETLLELRYDTIEEINVDSKAEYTA